MNIYITEEKRHEYFNHWAYVNFVEAPRSRPKVLTAAKCKDVRFDIWNDNDGFWLPLLKYGIEYQTPEMMAEERGQQYSEMMELMSDMMVNAAALI